MAKRFPLLFKCLLATIIFISLSGCDRSGQQKLIIISTNDIHSAVDRFPALAGLVEQYRADDGVPVILVDAGDRWTGNPYVDLATPRYYPVIELMNRLGFDVATFGNHEWDSGLEVLAERTLEAGFSKILANADMTATPMEPVPGYVYMDVAGIRICFFGLVTTAVNGHPDGKDESFGATVFTDPVGTAARMAQQLRQTCDLLVAVTHVGLMEDIRIASEVPGIDLIIGGHSHDTLHYGKRVNDVLITQTGKSLRYAGLTEITTRKGRVTSIQNRMIALDSIAPSAVYSDMVAGYYANPDLRKPVGSVSEDMDKTALINMFSDIMRKSTGAEFALFNVGSMRIDSLARGEVTLADIFAAEPFSNSPVVVGMTLEEIKDLVLNKFNADDKEGRRVDLFPSGMNYRIVVDEQGRGTDVFFSHNYYPEQGRQYRVAMSDYVNQQYNFSKRGEGEPAGFLLTGMLIDYLSENSPYRPDSRMRVQIEQN